ncbi:MAG: energy transducer TonB [Methylococcus sp.]|nr:energy transducer TonB [Methylococcus sp.]
MASQIIQIPPESLYRPGAPILLLVGALHLGVWWYYHHIKLIESQMVPEKVIEVALEMIQPAPKPAEPAASPAPPAPTAPPKPVEPPKPKPKPVVKPKPAVTKPKPLPVQPDRSLGDTAAKSEPASAPPPVPSSSARADGAAGGSGEAAAPPTPASFNANYLHNPLPEYPAFAKKQKWQGRVTMKVHVLPTGLPAEVELQSSSGHDILDESAIETVRRWRFVPATKGGKPVASWVVVPLEFSLTH